MVIGIVVAIGAIALPFTLREIDRRREAEAFDRFGLLCRMARAEARASGVPVVLVVEETGMVLKARRLDPRDETAVEGIATDLGIDEADRGETDAVEDGVAIVASWARLTLPDGCRCEPPPDPDEGASSAVDAFGFDGFDDESTFDAVFDGSITVWDGPVRLVLFLPDGAAISTRSFGVRTSRGWRSITIDPYGGGPSVGDVADPSALDAGTFEDETATSIDDSADVPTGAWDDDETAARTSEATP